MKLTGNLLIDYKDLEEKCRKEGFISNDDHPTLDDGSAPEKYQTVDHNGEIGECYGDDVLSFFMIKPISEKVWPHVYKDDKYRLKVIDSRDREIKFGQLFVSRPGGTLFRLNGAKIINGVEHVNVSRIISVSDDSMSCQNRLGWDRAKMYRLNVVQKDGSFEFDSPKTIVDEREEEDASLKKFFIAMVPISLLLILILKGIL